MSEVFDVDLDLNLIITSTCRQNQIEFVTGDVQYGGSFVS